MTENNLMDLKQKPPCALLRFERAVAVAVALCTARVWLNCNTCDPEPKREAGDVWCLVYPLSGILAPLLDFTFLPVLSFCLVLWLFMFSSISVCVCLSFCLCLSLCYWPIFLSTFQKLLNFVSQKACFFVWPVFVCLFLSSCCFCCWKVC